MSYGERNGGNPVNRRGPFVIVGACGFLGSEIFLQLIAKLSGGKHQHPPRIIGIVRSTAPEDVNPRLRAHSSAGVEVELICSRAGGGSGGGVMTMQELEQLLHERCSGYIAGIFHVAGMAVPSADPADVALMKQSNVDLSNVIFSFAAKYNIRCVYSSCSGVVGCQFPEDGLTRAAHDDARVCELSIAPFPYLVQKASVEEKWQQEALKGRAPIIILRPSTLFGPGDERLSSTDVLYHIMRGALRTSQSGGISFVDVRDCAKAFVRAMLDDSIEAGTAMNLTACNMPFDAFVELVEKTLRVKGPRIGLPPAVELAVARVESRVRRALRMPENLRNTPIAVTRRQRFWNVTCQRAKELLEWDPTELEETILDTSRYIYRTFMAVGGPSDGREGQRHAAVAAAAREGRRDLWRLPASGFRGTRLDGYVMVLVVLVVTLVILVVRDHQAVTSP